jgi:hypothetical protein
MTQNRRKKPNTSPKITNKKQQTNKQTKNHFYGLTIYFIFLQSPSKLKPK